MRRGLIGCAILGVALGTLLTRASAESEAGAQPPAGARRGEQAAPAQPPEFTAAGFAELAGRVEQLRREQEKMLQQRKGESIQFTDCARVGFKLVRADGGGEFSCPANKVIQSIAVGPKSSGVSAFRLELDLMCCSVGMKGAPAK